MKKKFTLKHFLLAGLMLFGISLSQQSRACVDQAAWVRVTCHYDTVNWEDVAVTVSNLNLAGGAPNQFCSCAINGVTSIWSDIQYVAFVDSGTTNPVAGFDVWTPDANASNAWSNVVQFGTWDGFVANVNQNGLLNGVPVELIIRAKLPMGFTFSVLDSSLSSSQVGTDEWDANGDSLANSHQQVNWLTSGGAPTYMPEGAQSTYFDDLDNALMTSLEEQLQPALLEIFPVPVVDKLYVKLADPSLFIEGLELYSVNGQQMMEIEHLNQGPAVLDMSGYVPGVYFLRVRTDEGMVTKKVIKTH